MENRIKEKLEEVKAINDSNKQLTAFGSGILAGINQTLLWLLEPDDWAEPISTIPGLEGS